MPAPRKDYSFAVEMYGNGNSIEEVAIVHGISRQAMHKILKTRGVVFREKYKLGEKNHFFVDGSGYEPHQVKARQKVMKALKSGRLKPRPCELCGFEGRAKDGRNLVHAHHDDYSKPLEVRWICVKCHYKEHH